MNLDNIYCKYFIIDDIKKDKIYIEYINNIKKNGYREPIIKNNNIYINIQDSIEYKILLNKKEIEYEKLLKKIEEKNIIEKYNLLLKNFHINKIKCYRDIEIDKPYIINGIEELSVLLYKKEINIKTNIIEYLDIEYSENIIKLIKNNLSNTTKINHSNGWYNRTLYGYHSFNINNINIIGQRNPNIRLKKIREYINFKNKTLIDFGCNNGGMIFHIPELTKAIGIDFDKNCIKSCKEISLILGYDIEYKFKQEDLNNFNLIEYLYEEKINEVDIIFLLSLGSWVKNWKKLYEDSLKKSKIIVLETNNDKEGTPQLELFRELRCEIKMISDKSDDDMTGNIGRKTYIIKKKE